MLKSQLLARVAELETDNRDWAEADKTKREHLSNFLGKRKRDDDDRFGFRRSGEALSWPEIYFELGKLKEQVHQKDIGDKLEELSMRVTYTQEELAKVKEEPLREEDIIDPRGGNASRYAGRGRV